MTERVSRKRLREVTEALTDQALRTLIQDTIAQLRLLQDQLDFLTAEKYKRDQAFYGESNDRRKPNG